MKVASGLIIILAIAIGVVPFFTDCESTGRMLTLADGRETSMKCHWTGRAELGLSIPLLVVGVMMRFAKRKQSRRILGIVAALLGVVAIMFPTVLIGVCMNPDMSCVSTMKPALLLAAILVFGIGVGVTVASWGPEDDQV